MKSFNVFTYVCLGLSFHSIAQTNRINHFSHSGNQSTLSIFKSNDHMGLNCGSPYNQEYIPDTTAILFVADSTKLDSIKSKVCTPNNTVPVVTPRRGLSLEIKFKVEDVLGKF